MRCPGMHAVMLFVRVATNQHVPQVSDPLVIQELMFSSPKFNGEFDRFLLFFSVLSDFSVRRYWNQCLGVDFQQSEHFGLQGCGLGQCEKDTLRLSRQGQLVEREGCQVAHERVEAVDRESVFGALSSGLALGFRRHAGFLDRR